MKKFHQSLTSIGLGITLSFLAVGCGSSESDPAVATPVAQSPQSAYETARSQYVYRVLRDQTPPYRYSYAQKIEACENYRTAIETVRLARKEHRALPKGVVIEDEETLVGTETTLTSYKKRFASAKRAEEKKAAPREQHDGDPHGHR